MPTALPPDTDFTNATTQGAAKTAYSGMRAFLAGLLGTTGSASAARDSLGLIETGQCRLDYVSTTQIKLSPLNGDRIVINGAVKSIPSAGITLANTGLTAATLYYIYVYDNAGTLTLEASATGHSADSTAGNVGVEIKTGDATRTLVGMVYMDSGTPGTFANAATKRFVASWFNQLPQPLTIGTTGGSTTSTSAVEINSAKRLQFVCWGHNLVTASVFGVVSNNVAGQGGYLRPGLDGVVQGALAGGFSFGVSSQFNVCANYSGVLVEGYHYFTTMGQATASTFSLNGNQINAEVS